MSFFNHKDKENIGTNQIGFYVMLYMSFSCKLIYIIIIKINFILLNTLSHMRPIPTSGET